MGRVLQPGGGHVDQDCGGVAVGHGVAPFVEADAWASALIILVDEDAVAEDVAFLAHAHVPEAQAVLVGVVRVWGVVGEDGGARHMEGLVVGLDQAALGVLVVGLAGRGQVEFEGLVLLGLKTGLNAFVHEPVVVLGPGLVVLVQLDCLMEAALEHVWGVAVLVWVLGLDRSVGLLDHDGAGVVS